MAPWLTSCLAHCNHVDVTIVTVHGNNLLSFTLHNMMNFSLNFSLLCSKQFPHYLVSLITYVPPSKKQTTFQANLKKLLLICCLPLLSVFTATFNYVERTYTFMIDAMCRECIKTFLFQKKISQDGIWVQHLLEKHPKELEKKSTDIQLINTEVRKIKNLFHINNRQII